MSEDIETNTKFAQIQAFDPEKNGITYSISGQDKDKVVVSQDGNIILDKSLDYEQKKELNFVVDVFDGKNTVSQQVVIDIDNVNDISASVNLSNATIHEGKLPNSTIGKINVVGDSTLSYSLSGNNSNDFIISPNGDIKIKLLRLFFKRFLQFETNS